MIILKELPGVPVGTEIVWTGSEYRVEKPQQGAIHFFSHEVVLANPEWFGHPQQVQTEPHTVVGGNKVRAQEPKTSKVKAKTK